MALGQEVFRMAMDKARKNSSRDILTLPLRAELLSRYLRGYFEVFPPAETGELPT